MKKTTCPQCNKRNNSANSVPFSQKKTKRVQKINLQKANGKLLCANCIKTAKKNQAKKA
jgi:ribosomal protein L28